MTTQSSALHAQSIVIDAVCPLAQPGSVHLDWYREGGVTALAPSIETDDVRGTLRDLAAWHRLLSERHDLMLVRQAQDIESAKRTRRLGLYFHFQGAEPVQGNLDLVELYKALGVGIIQLTYNVKNHVGDGCEERTDAGLSRFGVELIKRMNRARVIVDCSHTGLRTSLDAIECSSAPVVLSHSNAASVHSSPRNVSNELMDAIAASGGLIGVAGFPGMVSASTTPTLAQYIAHIDVIAERVGIDHVALGIDYYTMQAGVAGDEAALAAYTAAIEAGIWSTAYPRPPHHYPAGIETPQTLSNLTHALLERGYREADVRKIIGENWLRVMRQVWG